LILKKTILKIYNELKIFYNERVDEIKFTYEIFKEVNKSLNSEYKRFKNYNKSSSFKSKESTKNKKFTEEYENHFGRAYTDSDLKELNTTTLRLIKVKITFRKLF
jgi:uncharacterized protein YktA (UPF0223 family)